MVKDHSDSEKGNPLPPHRLTHTTAFVTPVVVAIRLVKSTFSAFPPFRPLLKPICLTNFYVINISNVKNSSLALKRMVRCE